MRPHEKMALTLCAYRNDPTVSASAFVDALERYEAAVRRNERGDVDLIAAANTDREGQQS